MQIWIQKLLPQHSISRLFGQLARCRVVWLKNLLIRYFIHHFKVDMSEAVEENYQRYPNFNAFFTRPLKPGVRHQPQDPSAIASPVDGFISELGSIQEQQLFQAKGHTYSLTHLLAGHHEDAKLFQNGAFFTAYLSPRDYHRVHMPAAGRLVRMVHVPGSLFSVNPYTVKNLPNLFACNERVICYFDTDHGPMAVIMIGAIIVASIHMTWHGIVTPPTRSLLQQWNYDDRSIFLNRGDEMGYFEVGSTAIVLFAENTMSFESFLKPEQMICLGQMIGRYR